MKPAEFTACRLQAPQWPYWRLLDHDRAKLFGSSNMAMNMLLRRMGRGDLTVHGLRSTFATWRRG
jgi:hypothetical protein